MNSNKDISEKTELRAIQAMHESASEELKSSLGLGFEQIGGIACSVSSIEPSILINRCFVTDEAALKNPDVIAEVKDCYAKSGVSRFFMHVAGSNEETGKVLNRASMKKARGWMKFVRDNSPAETRNPELDIRKIDAQQAEDFARIVIPCFDMCEASIPLIVSMARHPNWHLYMGYADHKPAATGAIYLQDGAAHCDWGSTHSDFRKRGFQGALLSRRINDAIEMGAKHLFTETGESVPDDPQHSYRNILRYGFAEDYLRENWAPE